MRIVERPSSDFFSTNRKRLAEQMKLGSIAVFVSNDMYPASADAFLPFVQHTEMYYLTGIDQEETKLILQKNLDGSIISHLFLIETNDYIKVWEGYKYTKEEAFSISAVEKIHWSDQFEKVLKSTAQASEYIYLQTHEHYRASVHTETQIDRFRAECMKLFPLHKYERSFPIMNALRGIKSSEEVALIQKACTITEKCFRHALTIVKPGIWEYELEAEMLYLAQKQKAMGFSFEPIMASGENSNILHYTTNNKQCKDGDLILIDFGHNYSYYASDVTRTIPVNGRYTSRQKEVYQAVRNVQKQAIDLMTPAVNWKEFHEQVGEIMTEQLVNIRLLSMEEVKNQNPDWPAYKKYFMHGTAHHLGLNVHDYGQLDVKFTPGMVYTCEPGIYIPEEGFGIRIENDILITEGTAFDLCRDIPVEAEEIEDLMNS